MILDVGYVVAHLVEYSLPKLAIYGSNPTLRWVFRMGRFQIK